MLRRSVIAWSLVLLGCAPDASPRTAHHAASERRAGGHSGAPSSARRAEDRSDPPAPAPKEAFLSRTYSGRRPLSVENGQASYYGKSFAGRRTASGETYDPQGFTAAHRKLPFGTVIRVTRRDTNASVYVRVTDRGPFGSSRRILDLSHAAADRLGMIRSGVAEVRLEVLEYGSRRRR